MLLVAGERGLGVVVLVRKIGDADHVDVNPRAETVCATASARISGGGAVGGPAARVHGLNSSRADVDPQADRILLLQLCRNDSLYVFSAVDIYPPSMNRQSCWRRARVVNGVDGIIELTGSLNRRAPCLCRPGKLCPRIGAVFHRSQLQFRLNEQVFQSFVKFRGGRRRCSEENEASNGGYAAGTYRSLYMRNSPSLRQLRPWPSDRRSLSQYTTDSSQRDACTHDNSAGTCLSYATAGDEGEAKDSLVGQVDSRMPHCPRARLPRLCLTMVRLGIGTLA